jgi:pimeloyl-ACP methyl ester carboxylesterase
MVGEFDEAGPEIVRRFARLTPGARYFVIPNSAHVFEWDNPEASTRAVREFLRDVDAGTAVARR